MPIFIALHTIEWSHITSLNIFIQAIKLKYTQILCESYNQISKVTHEMPGKLISLPTFRFIGDGEFV